VTSERLGLAADVRQLHETLLALHAAPDVRAALADVTEPLLELLDARMVALHLSDEDMLEVVSVAGDPAGKTLLGTRAPVDTWIRLLAASTPNSGVHLCRDPRDFLSDVVHEPVDSELALYGDEGHWGALNQLVAPFVTSADLVGVLTVTFHAGTPRPDEVVCAVLEMFAAQASVALHHQRFVDGSAADHLALRLSEERFRLAFDNAPIGMAEFVEGGDGLEIARINRAAGQMFGVNVFGAQHEPIDRVLTVVHGERLGDAMARLLKDDRRGLRMEVPFVGADGEEFWGLVEAAALLDVGGRSGILCQIVDITQSKAEERELTKRALHDPLTGLPNRQTVIEHLETVVREARETDQLGALLFCDLDNFKAVNDKHGHLVGDDALAELANRLHQTVRKSDVAGRFGGDEFVVVAYPVSLEEAQALGDRISAAMSEPMIFDGAALRIGVSIGIAMVTGAVERSEVLRRADAAMYAVRARQRRPRYIVDTA
jgi:diguanylate cyclase (GGDEF)-like protein/PAS domain S-box-containing protein